jgi:hypothetical protein
MPSGVKAFSLTANDLIAAALKKIGVYEAGEPAQPDEIEDGRIALNLMLKSWPARGVDIQWRSTITVFLSEGTQSYSLGTAHATASYVETTLAADAATGVTTVNLTSTAGVNSADFIGIRLDDRTIHWTIVNSLGTLIGAGLPSSASAGNAVYTYTTKAYRPTNILHVMRREGDRDTDISQIGDAEYLRLSLKGSTGLVNQINYQRQSTTGLLRVWPPGGEKLVLRCQNEPDTLVLLTDVPDCGSEWYEAMIYNLAVRLAPDYGLLTAKELALLTVQAERFLNDALDYDVENASVVFVAETR